MAERRDLAPPIAPAVTVVILNHNGGPILHVLRENAQAVRNQRYGGDVQLILVDDNSHDGSDRDVERLCGEVGALFLSTRDGNHGVSAARNRALEVARGEYVAFLDNDAVPEEGWLEALVARMEADEHLGACASCVVFMDRPDIVNSMGSVVNEHFYGTNVGIHELLEFAEAPDEVMYATGNGMILRRRAIEEVGPFDEGFLYWGADDADYGMRLRRRGWAIGVAGEARVRHLHSFSKTQAGMPFWDGRNRIRMALKHLAWHELAGFLPWDVLRNASPRGLGPYLRGWWSTLTHVPGITDLLAYRWARRGEPSFRGAFAGYLRVGNRFFVAHDNRGYGREIAPLSRLTPGEGDETYLYHGWFWVERRRPEPFRWALPNASLVFSLPEGASAFRLRLLLPRGHGGGALRVLARRAEPGDSATCLDTELCLPGGDGRTAREHIVPCRLPPGAYRLILVAERAHWERGRFPRRIGFGLAGLDVEAA